MSDPVSALSHASYDGFASIREIGPLGMITFRAGPDLPGLADAIRNVTGTDVPALRRIEINGDRAVGWMGPDEYLLVLPYDGVSAAMQTLHNILTNNHFLAVDVSDARAVFRIGGALAGDVLTKLSPVDVATLAPGELRRTRAAQVAAAFWRQDDGFTLVCFRSVAGYVMALLAQSARPGSTLDG